MLLRLKSEGLAESTLEGIAKRLRHLNRHTDLQNPLEVKSYISGLKATNGYKQSLVLAYQHYCRFAGLPFSPPRYVRREREIQVPSEENLNLLINSASRELALRLKILKETGLRPKELLNLRVRDLDLEKGLIAVRTIKGGKPRTLEVKRSTLGMLKYHVETKGLGLNDRLFPENTKALRRKYEKHRRRVAKLFHKPELLKIRLYDFRHFYATNLYRKTRDILYVKEKLGHKLIETTLKYVHLVDRLGEPEYECRVAENLKEAAALIEQGYEYVTTFEGKMLFRKLK